MAKKETAPETVEQAPVPANQGLNLSDIRSCVAIIDIVTKRGAFEGAVRNRLEGFLKAADEAQAAKVAEEEVATEK